MNCSGFWNLGLLLSPWPPPQMFWFWLGQGARRKHLRGQWAILRAVALCCFSGWGPGPAEPLGNPLVLVWTGSAGWSVGVTWSWRRVQKCGWRACAWMVWGGRGHGQARGLARQGLKGWRPTPPASCASVAPDLGPSQPPSPWAPGGWWGLQTSQQVYVLAQERWSRRPRAPAEPLHWHSASESSAQRPLEWGLWGVTLGAAALCWGCCSCLGVTSHSPLCLQGHRDGGRIVGGRHRAGGCLRGSEVPDASSDLLCVGKQTHPCSREKLNDCATETDERPQDGWSRRGHGVGESGAGWALWEGAPFWRTEWCKCRHKCGAGECELGTVSGPGTAGSPGRGWG